MIIRKLKKKLAFSLIEISIVILIISVLVLGLIKGGQIINKAKTISASKITKSSVVSKIDNLVAWYETTMNESFDDSEASNGNQVSTWYNINPYNKSIENSSSASPIGINAYQTTLANQPTYIANAINGLPALRFDGTDDYLNYDGTAIAKSNYSVVVVEQRRSNKSENYFIGGYNHIDNPNANQFLYLGYESDVLLAFYQYINNIDVTITGYTSPIPRIHSFIFNSRIGKDIYVNGINLTTCTTTDCKTALASYINPYIGKLHSTMESVGYDYYYNGDIGEIIIYKKALTDQERQDVETYLSKKWSIALSS